MLLKVKLMFVCLPDDIAKIRQAKNAPVAFGGLWSDVVTFSRKKTLPVTYRVARTGKEKKVVECKDELTIYGGECAGKAYGNGAGRL